MVGQCFHDVSVVSELELDQLVVGVADSEDQKPTIRGVDLDCILIQLTCANSWSSTMVGMAAQSGHLYAEQCAQRECRSLDLLHTQGIYCSV